MTTPGWSDLAEAQADELMVGDDADLYNAVLDAVEFVLSLPERAQAASQGIKSPKFQGIVMRLPVAGHPPWKVFWRTDGPTVEAILPFPT